MPNEWDSSANMESIAPVQQMEARNIDWQQRRREHEEQQERRYGSVEIARISDTNIREYFPYHIHHELDYGGGLASWTANKPMWMCHNCGAFGYKLGIVRELFKCYHCSSRNVTVCRAGEISMAIRGYHLGVHMQEVFERRTARLAIARIERRNARINSPTV